MLRAASNVAKKETELGVSLEGTKHCRAHGHEHPFELRFNPVGIWGTRPPLQ